MLYLFVAIAAFFLGVFVHPGLHAKTRALAFVDAVIVLSVLALLGFSLLPHTLEESGVLGAAGIAVGFTLTFLFDRLSSTHRSSGRPWAMVAMITALVAHSLFDGAALALPGHHEEQAAQSVVIGVLLHRLPLGMVVHHLLGPKLKLPLLVATLISVSTILGFFFADQIFTQSQESAQHLLEAFVVGMLIQVVVAHVGSLQALARPAE